MTTPTKRPGRAAARAAGFTLVELLVTVSIIAILAGVVLGALNAARKTAKIAKTRATIVKLNRIIMKKYDSYAFRRIPISTTGMDPAEASYLRYQALHDLMRMEMPYLASDVKASNRNPTILSDRPAISKCYLLAYESCEPSPEFFDAECLYMIVAAGDATALEDFSESEIGDYDNDGWSEFQDAWGEPIGFIRWAPMYLPPNTDLQSNEFDSARGDFVSTNPFDPMRQDRHPISGARISYKLIPLIFSAGLDKQCDISPGDFVFDGSPFMTLRGRAAGTLNDAGKPVDDDNDGLGHYDNITNHRLETEVR